MPVGCDHPNHATRHQTIHSGCLQREEGEPEEGEPEQGELEEGEPEDVQ
jgi:hypothetical protein